MRRTIAVLLLGVSWFAMPMSIAQHIHGGDGSGAGGRPERPQGPYAGMQARSIKALSEQQLADLRAGKGMSLALPAELNGYPGPAHVLELADSLTLTAEQKARTQALFTKMVNEAKVAGENVIDAEAALDRLFGEKRATAEAIGEATARAAAAHGRLRETHLRYHLAMAQLLSPEQLATYNRLRGY
jgi:hypothetical protein